MSEVKKYIPYIIQKSGLDEDQIKRILDEILENLNLAPLLEYAGKIEDTKKINGKIDEKDIQFIILALSMENNGI